MVATVLFVCAQNVCRSPLMAAVFADAVGVGVESGSDGWIVDSAGTGAHPGRRSCRVAAEVEPAVVGHHSRLLEAADLDRADLVIAASLAERAVIAQLRPAARSRTFTLREALMLGERGGAKPAASLAEHVAALDARRGTLELSRWRALPWRRDRQHPLDVVDVHQFGRRTHLRGLVEASADTRRFAVQLQGVLGLRS